MRLECEASILRSIHSFSELVGCITSDLVGIVDWESVLFESHDLASVGQHDLKTKALNKVNIYQGDPSFIYYKYKHFTDMYTQCHFNKNILINQNVSIRTKHGL